MKAGKKNEAWDGKEDATLSKGGWPEWSSAWLGKRKNANRMKRDVGVPVERKGWRILGSKQNIFSAASGERYTSPKEGDRTKLEEKSLSRIQQGQVTACTGTERRGSATTLMTTDCKKTSVDINWVRKGELDFNGERGEYVSRLKSRRRKREFLKEKNGDSNSP